MILSTESAGTMIREGHRGLLETLREFALAFDGTEHRLPEAGELRAMIAFLRQGLIPFTQHEERHLEGCAVVTEDTAFEHAFLNAEIDVLASAVASLEHGDARSRTGGAARVRRHVHRIEAILELHVQKAVDREITFASPGAEPDARTQRGGGAVRTMDSAEIHSFLLRHEWGILGTVGDGVPYAVPVSYGFDGSFLYVASGPGRKRRNLEMGSAVCITVPEVEDGDRWSSVIVTGQARPVDDLRGKLHALNAIRRQRTNGAATSAGDLARAARASIFRITPDEITGRTRG